MSERFVDTGVAVHLPQTDRIRGRVGARSVHGYFGRVLTRQQAVASDSPPCERCFPEGFGLAVSPPASEEPT